jgi:hypothetical protein
VNLLTDSQTPGLNPFEILSMLRKKLVLGALLLVAVAVAVAVALGVSLSMSRNEASEPDSGKPVAAVTYENMHPMDTPSVISTPLPTSRTQLPTSHRSSLPTTNPTVMPTTDLSALPSTRPTTGPKTTAATLQTTVPSTVSNDTTNMTLRPSASPLLSSVPTQTMTPTPSGTIHGCGHDQLLGQADCSVTIFYAIADVPYTSTDALALPLQVQSLPDNAEFLIHLGDIRSASKEKDCVLSDYRNISSILKLSRVPVFLVPGGK